MQFNTRFDIGDTAYVIKYRRVYTITPCGFCGGSGAITGKDHSKRNCPACQGGKHVTFSNEMPEMVPVTINAISLAATADTDHTSLSTMYKAGSVTEWEASLYTHEEAMAKLAEIIQKEAGT